MNLKLGVFACLWKKYYLWGGRLLFNPIANENKDSSIYVAG